MPGLHLSIPQQVTVENPAALKPAKFSEWTKTLAVSNAMETSIKLVSNLAKINRIQIKPGQRFQLMEVFRPLAAEVTSAMKDQHMHSIYPLSEKNLEVADQAGDLLREMAYGYKILINELSQFVKLTQSAEKVLTASLVHALTFLSKGVVETYLVYAPEPEGIWLEMNQIYGYAENRGLLHSWISEYEESEVVNYNVEQVYKRILMLGLAGPYHLMRGEAHTVYSTLATWAKGSTMKTPRSPDDVAGEYFVDLESDAGPRFAATERKTKTSFPRIIHIDSLIQKATENIQQITLDHKRKSGGAPALTLRDRMRRDLYLRLKQAWASRAERRFERDAKLSDAELCIGLSASHFFVSDGAPFNPEEDENRLLKGKADRGELDLTLTPLHTSNTPPAKNVSQHTGTPKEQKRISRFESMEISADVWQKVYSTAVFDDDEGGPTYTTSTWYLRDHSLGGISLFCDNNIPQQIQVGELVAFKTEEGEQFTDWSLGTVRWMQHFAEERVEIGIKTLAYSATPIATRALEGAGTGGESFRSLLIPQGNPEEKETTLLAPASIYDIGTVLIINMGEKLLYAKIKSMIDTTRSFSHLGFDLVDTPPIMKTKNEAPPKDHKPFRAL